MRAECTKTAESFPFIIAYYYVQFTRIWFGSWCACVLFTVVHICITHTHRPHKNIVAYEWNSCGLNRPSQNFGVKTLWVDGSCTLSVDRGTTLLSDMRITKEHSIGTIRPHTFNVGLQNFGLTASNLEVFFKLNVFSYDFHEWIERRRLFFFPPCDGRTRTAEIESKQ